MISPKFKIFSWAYGAVFALVLGGCSDGTAPSDLNAPVVVDTLAIATLSGGGGVRAVASNVALTLSIADPATDTVATRALLFGQLLGNGDKGRTLIATSATEAGFNRFASFLTDGTNDQMGYSVFAPLVGGSGTLMAESSFFSRRVGSGVDFAGYTITSLEFHVDSISFVTPGRDPNRDGIWTDMYLRGNLVVLGHPN